MSCLKVLFLNHTIMFRCLTIYTVSTQWQTSVEPFTVCTYKVQRKVTVLSHERWTETRMILASVESFTASASVSVNGDRDFAGMGLGLVNLFFSMGNGYRCS